MDKKTIYIVLAIIAAAAIIVPLAMDRNITPLHRAVEVGNIEEAEKLIKEGADVNAQTKHGYTPLHLATYRKRVEIVALLLRNGANPDLQDMNGETPLFNCSYRQQRQKNTEVDYNMAMLLVDNGARTDIKNKEGKNAIEAAEARGYKNLAEALREYENHRTAPETQVTPETTP